jgi:hypothetical protein
MLSMHFAGRRQAECGSFGGFLTLWYRRSYLGLYHQTLFRFYMTEDTGAEPDITHRCVACSISLWQEVNGHVAHCWPLLSFLFHRCDVLDVRLSAQPYNTTSGDPCRNCRHSAVRPRTPWLEARKEDGIHCQVGKGAVCAGSLRLLACCVLRISYHQITLPFACSGREVGDCEEDDRRVYPTSRAFVQAHSRRGGHER